MILLTLRLIMGQMQEMTNLRQSPICLLTIGGRV
jgi:hypothetical protein